MQGYNKLKDDGGKLSESQFALDANLMAIEKFNGFVRLLNCLHQVASKFHPKPKSGTQLNVRALFTTHMPNQKKKIFWNGKTDIDASNLG